MIIPNNLLMILIKVEGIILITTAAISESKYFTGII